MQVTKITYNKKLCIFLSVLFAMLAFAGNGWGQSLTNGGFEANTASPGTGWAITTGSGNFSYTLNAGTPRTGVNNIQTANFTNYGICNVGISYCDYIENSNAFTVASNNYLHIICWAYISSITGSGRLWFSANNYNMADHSAATVLTTSYAQYSDDIKETGNAATGLSQTTNNKIDIGFANGSATARTWYLDDVVAYTDANSTSDLTSPNVGSGFTNGTITSSSVGFTWTNGADAGSPATGVQGYVVLRTTNTGAAAPTLNNQGIYSVAGGTSGPKNDGSGNWTVISFGGGATDGSAGNYTDNTVAASTSYKYAIINYDLAYNYSTALVSGTITTPAGGSCTSSPTVTSTAASGITSSGASSGGNVTSAGTGGCTVTAKGVCWNTSAGPTIANSTTNDGTGTGVYTSTITGLSPGTKYYYKAYATNGFGTAYGAESNFTTPAASATTLYTQNFDGSVTGWTTSGATPWCLSSSAPTSSGYAGSSGGYYALNGSNGSYLIFSNNLSTVGYTNITVTWGGYRSSASATTPIFEWSPDGSTWTAAAFTDVGVGAWALVSSISLPAGAAGISNLHFRWTSKCSTTFQWRMDDFTVSGTAASGSSYCSASGGGDEYITGVQCGSISNTGTASDGYHDYTALSTNMTIGSPNTITITNGNGYSLDYCGIWVDWNQNNVFTDAGEAISVTGNPGYGPYTATITPPAGATLGSTRMRVRIDYNNSSISPCGTTVFGEVEDYTINVQASCASPATQATSFTTGAITSSSIVVGWTRGTGNDVMVVCAAGSAPTDPVDGSSYTANAAYGSGTSCGGGYVVYNSTGTTVTVTNLQPSTTYYFAIYEYSTTGPCYNLSELAGSASTIASSNTITTGVVSTSPFAVTCAAGKAGTVAFTSSGTFTANTFTAQLSDATGSFTSPVNIGTLASSGSNPSGTINITIPAQTPSGAGYKIRVVSSGPSITGSSAAALTINLTGSCTVYPQLTGILVNSCNGTCTEGNNELLFFRTGSNPISVTDGITAAANIQVYYGTASPPTANYTESFVSNTTWVNNWNTQAGCGTLCYDALTAGTIPANSIIVITQSGLCYTYDFSNFCSRGPIYVLFSNDPTWKNSGNWANENDGIPPTRYFRTIVTSSAGTTTIDYSYNTDMLTSHADGDAISFPNCNSSSGCFLAASTYFNNGCTIMAPAILPIELMTFNARCADNNVDISWSTATETNNDYYTVERSKDGETWENVTIVKGAGNSNSPLYYNIKDDAPAFAVSYYRLKQTDFNGNSKTFDPVAVSCNSNVADYFILKPNPANNEVTCSVVASEENNATVVIINYLGQKICMHNYSLIKGSNDLKLDVSQFSNGVYTVIVYSANGDLVNSKQLVIQKR